MHDVRPPKGLGATSTAPDTAPPAMPQAGAAPTAQGFTATQAMPELRASVDGLWPENGHPVVLLDPRPETHRAVTQFRRAGIPLCVLTSRRLEPAFYARGIQRRHLAAIESHPEKWEARLLELAAQLEPRAILMPCSRAATQLLRTLHGRLSPHFAVTHLQSLMPEGLQNAPTAEAALRRAVLRGEPAIEVQIVLDQSSACTAHCALTWTAGARPDAIVTSIEGAELIEDSVALLRQHGLVGYARLVWAPDRHGRLVLHAASVLPGLGWSVALEDGVDFPRQWYAALVGEDRLPQTAAHLVSKRLSIMEPGTNDDTLPLSVYTPAWSWKDPLPSVAGFLCSMVRR